jgi:hypothetical protein
LVAGVLALAGIVANTAGCSAKEATMLDGVKGDVATLGKLVTLTPRPAEAKWSVEKLGSDAVPGPADEVLWAVLRYSDADYAAVSHAIEADRARGPATVAGGTGAPPEWLLKEVDLARFRHGNDYQFEGVFSNGKPFTSDLYATGFALMLPDHRVLIRFSTR